MEVKLTNSPEGYTPIVAQPEKSSQASLPAQGPESKDSVNEGQKPAIKAVSKQELTQISQDLSKFMEEMSAGIQFVVHEKTNSLMVQVIDAKSSKVLREFPSKEFLDTIANIREYVGFLLDKKA